MNDMPQTVDLATPSQFFVPTPQPPALDPWEALAAAPDAVPHDRFASTKDAAHLREMARALLNVEASAETVAIEPAPAIDAPGYWMKPTGL